MGAGSTSTICSATAVICILPTSPEWNNRFQDQELQRATPVLLYIGEMGGWGGGSWLLEAEAQKTLILFPEGIKRAKGEVVKTERRFISLVKASPEDLCAN